MSRAAKFRLRVTLTTEDDPGGVTLYGETMTQAECSDLSRRLAVMIAHPKQRAAIKVVDLHGRVVIDRSRR